MVAHGGCMVWYVDWSYFIIFSHIFRWSIVPFPSEPFHDAQGMEVSVAMAGVGPYPPANIGKQAWQVYIPTFERNIMEHQFICWCSWNFHLPGLDSQWAPCCWTNVPCDPVLVGHRLTRPQISAVLPAVPFMPVMVPWRVAPAPVTPVTPVGVLVPSGQGRYPNTNAGFRFHCFHDYDDQSSWIDVVHGNTAQIPTLQSVKHQVSMNSRPVEWTVGECRAPSWPSPHRQTLATTWSPWSDHDPCLRWLMQTASFLASVCVCWLWMFGFLKMPLGYDVAWFLGNQNIKYVVWTPNEIVCS